MGSYPIGLTLSSAPGRPGLRGFRSFPHKLRLIFTAGQGRDPLEQPSLGNHPLDIPAQSFPVLVGPYPHLMHLEGTFLILLVARNALRLPGNEAVLSPYGESRVPASEGA